MQPRALRDAIDGSALGLPENAETGRNCSGINILLLWVADIIVTATLAQSTFGLGTAMAVQISVGGPAIPADTDLPVSHELVARQERHAEHLTGNLETAIEYVATLDAAAREELRTLAVGVAIDLTKPCGDQRNRHNRKVGEKIAAMLGSDPTRHWTPDETFFRKLGKSALIEALAVMGRNTNELTKAKKGGLVSTAVRCAKDTGWLPEPIRVIDARLQDMMETKEAA